MFPGFKPALCLIPEIKPHPGNLDYVLIGGVSTSLVDAMDYAAQISLAVATQQSRKARVERQRLSVTDTEFAETVTVD